jgi:hypothetical protein
MTRQNRGVTTVTEPWTVEIFFADGSEVVTLENVAVMGDATIGKNCDTLRVMEVDGRFFSFNTYFSGGNTISLQGAREWTKDGVPVEHKGAIS